MKRDTDLKIDDCTLFLPRDIIRRSIANNAMGIRRLIEHSGFPEPIILNEGKRQEGTTRYSGRRSAWRAKDVHDWLDARQKASVKRSA
jgi:hypothetical protein